MIHPAQIELSEVDEQRYALAAFLHKTRARFVNRVRYRTGLDQRVVLSLEMLLEDFCDHVFDSIALGDWNTAFAWATTQNFYGNGDEGITGFLREISDELEHECEAMLPDFAPVLGEIRINLLRLYKLAARDKYVEWTPTGGFKDDDHDPVDVAVENVLASLDNKDFATGEHSRAVSGWCTRIARKLELSEAMIVKVTRGGLVHDIGKTTTPLEILTAARRLSDDERKIMQNHVVAGWEMLKALPSLQPFNSIVRNHHEKYEGGGYPDGFAHQDLPLSTRIVTVADCFNAMIGRRPYRAPMSPVAAVEELRRHRKTQFDPDVTDAMSELVYDMIEKSGVKVEREQAFVAPKGLVED